MEKDNKFLFFSEEDLESILQQIREEEMEKEIEEETEAEREYENEGIEEDNVIVKDEGSINCILKENEYVVDLYEEFGQFYLDAKLKIGDLKASEAYNCIRELKDLLCRYGFEDEILFLNIISDRSKDDMHIRLLIDANNIGVRDAFYMTTDIALVFCVFSAYRHE